MKFTMGLMILFSVLYIFMAIHSYISPETYRGFLVKDNLDLSFNRSDIEIPQTYEQWKEMGNGNVYFYYLKKSTQLKIFLYPIFYMIIIFIILKKLISFFKSVENFSSFYNTNSKIFYSIALLLSIKLVFSFLVNLFGMDFTMNFPDGSSHTVHHTSITGQLFTDAILALLALAASEIFKAGERLQTENDLTI